MSTASEMTLAAETMMATASSTTTAMAAVAAAHAAHQAASSKSSPAAKLGFSIDSIVGGGGEDGKKDKDRHIATAAAEIVAASRLRDSLTVADFSLALAARNGADNAAAAAAAAIHRPFNSSPNSPRSRRALNTSRLSRILFNFLSNANGLALLLTSGSLLQNLIVIK